MKTVTSRLSVIAIILSVMLWQYASNENLSSYVTEKKMLVAAILFSPLLFVVKTFTDYFRERLDKKKGRK